MAAPDLFQELMGLCVALAARKIGYAVCGGLALAVHGFPRATKDIDLLVEESSLREVCEVARTCGFTLRGADLEFKSGQRMARLIKPLPPGEDFLMLDLLLVEKNNRLAWETRQAVETSSGLIHVVSYEGLKAMKRQRNSLQDQADIQRLEDAQNGRSNEP
ncbi:MAG: hypothetical protein HY043_07580 [Verrucomicrobia bacterium]|nr:hypothetical protein [Verrucomicrobiota bacterium]